jgi:hypothetical protein
VRRDTSLTAEQRIARLRQAREEYVRLVRTVLNEEQLKKFEALLEEQSPALGSLADLRLSPEQMEKIREIVQRYNKIRQQITQDTSLTPDQRARRLTGSQRADDAGNPQRAAQEPAGALGQGAPARPAAAAQGEKKEEKKDTPPQNP